MVAAAVTHGKLEVQNIICDHLKPVSAKLREMGAIIEEGSRLTVDASGKLKSVDIKTLPLPRFSDRYAGADGSADEQHGRHKHRCGNDI